MQLTSAQWWFENRESGEITVAQFPNWPVFVIAAGWLIGRLAPDGSALQEGSSVAVTVLWLYWGGDEVVRGVNPWRRLLGAVVIAWQLIRTLQ